MNARRFLFGEDFRNPAPPQPAAEGVGLAAHQAALDAAGREAFARGVAAGRREAEAETARRLAESSERLGPALAAVLAAADARAEIVEDEAIAFFRALALKLAGSALAAQPLAAVADAAREAFRHLRGVPHLAARVDETLVDDVDTLLRRLAREGGYEGRIIVLPDPEIAPGDARLDWADGGVVRERRALDDAAAAVLARAFPTGPSGPTGPTGPARPASSTDARWTQEPHDHRD